MKRNILIFVMLLFLSCRCNYTKNEKTEELTIEWVESIYFEWPCIDCSCNEYLLLKFAYKNITNNSYYLPLSDSSIYFCEETKNHELKYWFNVILPNWSDTLYIYVIKDSNLFSKLKNYDSLFYFPDYNQAENMIDFYAFYLLDTSNIAKSYYL